MDKKSVSVYGSAITDINIIKKWVLDNFGFKIYNYQAVTFALTTLKSFDFAAVKHIGKRRGRRNFPFIDKFSVTLDRKLVDRVDVFLHAYDKVLIPSRTALVTALITYRVASLPTSLEPFKPIEFKYPEFEKRADEERYIRRLPELMADIAQ